MYLVTIVLACVIGLLQPAMVRAEATTTGAAKKSTTASKSKHRKSTKSHKAGAAKPASKEVTEAAASSLPAFCDEWMHKLQARETENETHIKWETKADGVSGDYVGYSKDDKCKVSEGSTTVPVGRISYVEIHYRKAGKTQIEAEHNPPQAVETEGVTEIFRYDPAKHSWIWQ